MFKFCRVILPQISQITRIFLANSSLITQIQRASNRLMEVCLMELSGKKQSVKFVKIIIR